MPVRVSKPQPPGRRSAAESAGDDIAAVTVYYNPLRYRRRFDNYVRFASDLHKAGVTLHTLEVIKPGDESQLSGHTPGVLEFGFSDSILWHKERAINALVETLPAIYSKIAWLDCDFIFPADRDWLAEASRMLDAVPVVQLYSSLLMEAKNGEAYEIRKSWAAARAEGERKRLSAHPPGGAWAAQRELFTHFGGLYDRLICGGADSLAACAFDGGINPAWLRKLSPELRADFEAWARPVSRFVRGEIGVLDLECCHLWHGSRSDKQYAERLAAVAGFDPEDELRRNASGLWEWNGNMDARNRDFLDYFTNRREGPMDSNL